MYKGIIYKYTSPSNKIYTSSCLNGRRKTAYNYIWKYYSNDYQQNLNL